MDLSQKLDYWTAMAATAFASATIVAISAFFLHKRAIEQILDEDPVTKGLNSDRSACSSNIEENNKRRATRPKHHKSHSPSKDRSWGSLQEPLALQSNKDSQCINTQRGSSKRQEQESNTCLRPKLGSHLNMLSSAIPPGLPRVQIDKEGIPIQIISVHFEHHLIKNILVVFTVFLNYCLQA